MSACAGPGKVIRLPMAESTPVPGVVPGTIIEDVQDSLPEAWPALIQADSHLEGVGAAEQGQGIRREFRVRAASLL